MDPVCIAKGPFLSSSSSSSRRTSLSYFSIHPVPPSSSSFLLLTHLHKISQGTDSLTPGLLAPLSSSPGASTQPRGISPKLAFVQAREHEISRWTGARTMNFALIIGCVAVTATLLMVSAVRRRGVTYFPLGKIVIQLERNNCHGERAVTA